MALSGSSIERPPLPGGPYLVVGLARSGIAAASALRRAGEDVIGVDSGEPEGLQRLAQEGVEVHTGSDGLSLLMGAQAVVKSPGVPQSAPAIVRAHAQGLPVIGELELGWRLLRNQVIAVTGTNGKTTTVELIAHIHAQAGLPVAAAGNVGIALCSLVGRIDETVSVVCEASSFQLEDTSAFAPEAAVLLNLSPDHLDRHESFDDYVAAKLHVFARQREQDLAVLPAGPAGVGVDTSGRPISTDSIEQRVHRLGGHAQIIRFGADEDAQMRSQDGALWWRGHKLMQASEIGIAGAHNLANAMAAAAVCLERGVPAQAVCAGLRSFPGVKHRLEQVAVKGRVAYVNDSKATNIASTLVALEAMRQRGPIHLIAGGQGKGQDFAALREPVRQSCAGVYLIGEDAAALAAALDGIGVPVIRCGELETAVARATSAARQAIASARWVAAARGVPASQEPAQIVLLAPGCASFDQFENFEARGERFRELVGSL